MGANQLSGTSLGRYQLGELIGEGAMGAVYLAVDPALDRQVAVKVLAGSTAASEERIERFEREARMVARLRHPHIVPVYDVGRSGGQLYLVMPFVAGGTLERWLSGEPVAFEPALRVLEQVADALDHAHGQGIVHRDLKPGNILLDEGAHVLLSDFGIAKSLGGPAGLTSTGVVVGTPSYLAPEQATEGTVDARTDVYALGVLAFELLTGALPFQSASALERVVAHLNAPPPSPRALNPAISGAAEKAILRALSKDPASRFASAGAFLRALADARPRSAANGARVVIVYRRGLEPDSALRDELERRLTEAGHRVFVDTQLTVGVEWARAIESEIRSADAVVALISARSIESEMLSYELELARQTARESTAEKPRILPVRVGYEGALPDELAAALDDIEYALWKGATDTPELLRQIEAALRGEPRLPPATEATIVLSRPGLLTDSGAVGGAVPIHSRYYVTRPSDAVFLSALDLRDSIVLVKGARQMGKTSLLARGMARARENGMRVALTDFQKLTSAHLESLEGFFMALGERIADQLDLDVLPSDVWREGRDPNLNFERYLRRHVLADPDVHVVWGLDEVDRLFSADFGGDVFALFRSWHNERSLDPQGPWGRLTLAIAYATEAHLFITDLNQSPFNVGTRVELRDFDRAEIAGLNQRYDAPLRDDAEIARYEQLVGGHPYLSRRGLHELTRSDMTLDALEAAADREDGPFSDHLRRILVSTTRNPELHQVLFGLLEGRAPESDDAFYRLRSGGLVRGASRRDAQIRCAVYARYLERHLR